MPQMSVVVPHNLSQDEARARIQNLLNDLKAQYGDRFSDLQESWSDHEGRFALKAMGFNVSGTLSVKPSEVELTGDLPFAAAPFKGRIEEVIRERAQRLLS
jgi:hypothetical protein